MTRSGTLQLHTCLMVPMTWVSFWPLAMSMWRLHVFQAIACLDPICHPHLRHVCYQLKWLLQITSSLSGWGRNGQRWCVLERKLVNRYVSGRIDGIVLRAGINLIGQRTSFYVKKNEFFDLVQWIFNTILFNGKILPLLHNQILTNLKHHWVISLFMLKSVDSNVSHTFITITFY